MQLRGQSVKPAACRGRNFTNHGKSPDEYGVVSEEGESWIWHAVMGCWP